MSTKDRIKAARKSQGLNQSELARQIGTSPQTVQQWEAGKTLPKGLNLLNLANALNVSAEWLQTGKENRSITDVTNNPSDQTSNEAMLLQIFQIGRAHV
jgi:transcriptional regulator with XRE-family HTH domain